MANNNADIEALYQYFKGLGVESVLDLYAQDSDFREMLKYYIDTKGAPTMTITDTPFGVNGSARVNGTVSVYDAGFIKGTQSPDRKQETIAHELLHNLGMRHDTDAAEEKMDAELDMLHDEKDSDLSGLDKKLWHNYSDDGRGSLRPLPDGHSSRAGRQSDQPKGHRVGEEIVGLLQRHQPKDHHAVAGDR